MLKRIVSTLLCLLMVVGAVAPAVSATSNVTYSTGLSSDDIYFADGSEVIYNDDGSITVHPSGTKETESSTSAKTPEVSAVPEELGQASATVADTTVDALGVPKDGSLKIQEAKPETEAVIEKMAADYEGGTSSELFRYDISVQDKDGLDWQPNGKVRLEMDAGRKLHKNEKVYVVHVSDDGKANYIDAQVTDAGTIVFETDGFSTFAGFTVDFEYENAKFSINGLTSILLSEVFQKLNAPLDVEDVKDVTFTDYSLIAIEKQGSDWKLTSLKAFQTTEALTMTMKDGTVREIKVTDATHATMWLYDGNTVIVQTVESTANGVVSLYLDSDGSPSSNDGYWNPGYQIVVKGSGTMAIVLQEPDGDTTKDNKVYWDLDQLKITDGAQVCIRIGGSFEGGETITIRGQEFDTGSGNPNNRAMFDIQDGSLWFNLHDEVDKTETGLPSATDFAVSTDKLNIVIDAQNKSTNKQSAIFYCGYGCENLVLNGLTFKNNDYRGIYCLANTMTRMRLRDCTFESSVRYLNGGGGAIRIEQVTKNEAYGETRNSNVDVANLELYDCQFNGNQTAPTLTDNISDHSGGAISCWGNLNNTVFDGCIFDGCKAKGRGGAVNIGSGSGSSGFNMGNFTFIDCQFIECESWNNTVTNADGEEETGTRNGGAVSFQDYNNGSLSFEGCTFTNNKAGGHGGDIVLSNGDSGITFSSISFTGCTFSGGTAGYRGGAVRITSANQPSLTINGTTFTNCTSGTQGGAVSLQGTIGDISMGTATVDGATVRTKFNGCSSTSTRGGAVAVMCSTVGDVTLTNADFWNNTAGSLGGAIQIGLTYADNLAVEDKTPISVGAVSVSGCTFENNKANGGAGGGLSLTDGTFASVSVSNSSFENCHSSNFGGAIALKMTAEDGTTPEFKVTGAVSITDCTFSGCTAGGLSPEPLGTDTDWDHDGDGGASTAEITRLNGTGGGGAICIGGPVGTSITIKDTTKDDDEIEFQNCYTWNNGGAICFLGWITTPKIELLNLDIDGCRARDAGSAIHVSNLIANELDMTSCDITNCAYFTSDFTLPDTLKNTYSTDLGTAAYASFDAGGTFRSIGNTTCVATLAGCHFEGNRSYENGAGIYWNANQARAGATVKDENGEDINPNIVPALTLSGCTFKDNIAERDGGGVYVEATVTVIDCDFESNEAWGRGGAIAQQVYSNEARTLGSTGDDEATNLILDEDTVIWNNHATHGGGISITVSDSVSFKPNTETGKYINYPVKFQLNGATVRDNYASQNGGGIYYAAVTYADEATQKKVDCFKKEILIDNGKIYGNKTGCDVSGNVVAVEDGTTRHGGGIYMFSNQANTGTDATSGQVYGHSWLTITDGYIYSNTANSGNGGGVYLTGKGASCLITGGNIGADADGVAAANTATKTSDGTGQDQGCGGGIAIYGGATITMRRPYQVDTDGNTVVDAEGNPVEDTTKNGGNVANNVAYFQGGGIWLADGTTTDGTANTIEISAGTISANKVYEEGNTSRTARNGGGIYAGEYGTVTLNGGTISGNSSAGWGGGIYCNTNAALTMNKGSDGNGGSITGNSASKGGGIAFQGAGKANIYGGTISDNTAASHGGGILSNGNASITVDGGNIIGNKAGYDDDLTDETTYTGDGGGIWASNGTIEVLSGSVKENEAQAGYGGGIYATNLAQIQVSGGSVNDNQAQFGGGIAAIDSSLTGEAFAVQVIQNTTTGVLGAVTGNTATEHGGGIYAKASRVKVEGNLNGNHATNGNGGGAYLMNGAFLDVSGTIGAENAGNTANSGIGGGIYATDANTAVTITGTVAYNEAKDGGGAAACHGATIDLTGTVSNNSATNNGGGIYADGGTVNILATDTATGLVQSNTAQNGGGIYGCNSAQITLAGNMYLNEATVRGGGAYLNGGSTLSVTGNIGAEDLGNTAATAGGGVFVTNAGSSVTVYGYIQHNSSKDGGGITVGQGANATITGGNVNNNTASVNGGGIYASGTGTVTIDSGNINNNKASENGGGIYTTGAKTVNITGGSVNSNAATKNGGGIYANGSNVSLGGNLNDNEATTGNGGGAYLMGGAELTVSGYVGEAEHGNTAALNGGGIYATGSGSKATITGNVQHNSAANGGGVALLDSAELLIPSGNIKSNEATTGSGGGVYASNGGKVTLSGGDIDSNKAYIYGGGVYAEINSTIAVTGGNVLNNEATTGNGGGLHVYDGSRVTISSGHIQGNKAMGTEEDMGYGGGVHAYDNSTVIIEGGDIHGNEARLGGGVSADVGSTITASGDIYENTATENGGGIYATGSGTTVTVDGSITNNTADVNGGGIYCLAVAAGAPTLTVYGNIENNKAVTHGGGIYTTRETGATAVTQITITGGSITNNHANCVKGTDGTYAAKAAKNEGNGGGVYISNATLTLQAKDGQGGLIDQNSAVNGGGIYAVDSTVTVYGNIQNNRAEFIATEDNADDVLLGLGGGICAYGIEGTTNISLSGNIQNNTAQVFGGGAYVEGSGSPTVDANDNQVFKANFTLTNGNIKENVASGRNGGGLLVSGNAIATINGGNIIDNDAVNGYGGGVHAYNGGHVVITGGSITGNEAKRGGGIAAEINANVLFTNVASMAADGGNLSRNKAEEFGGGIYCEASTVKVSGGTISYNTARNGGGIAAISQLSEGPSNQAVTLADTLSSVTVEGGAVSYNYAANGGGIYAKDEETEVIVRGGSIVNNQARSDYENPNLAVDANGSGGGIYVDNAKVQVNKPANSETAGMVKANEAARGGGVYVTNGGNLTVNGGFIIENLAHGNEDVVASNDNWNDWYKTTTMLGTGGGIFVTNGTSTDPSTFTLNAWDEDKVKADVAIYGNLADFAADDVFASGVNTKLNVPLVTQMNLAGYGFQPGGWFEDYAVDDENYEEGLNGGKNMGIVNGNVYRYRGAAVIYRIEIAPSDVNDATTLPANIANEFVCMTLGIPGAVGEEIVLDFGLSVEMELLDNDLVIKDNYTLTTNLLIGKTHPFQTVDGNNVPLEYQNLGKDATPADFDDELEGDYGYLKVTYSTNEDGTLNFKVTYTLKNMQFVGVETFTYAVCYQDIWYYADVKLIPATIIHFEDQNYQSDGTADPNNPFISYENGRWTAVKDGTTGHKYHQDGDRPGEDLEDLLKDLDKDNVYGYDSAYLNSSKYSLGMAMMTNVSAENPSSTATFTFWGTGFDIISQCSNKSGAIMVTIKRLDKTENDRYMMVDTYYSYIYDKTAKEWKISTQSQDNATYQIPVMRVDDLAYGQYWVEIYVGYDSWIFDHGQYGGGQYDFYLDAIRIYNPANDGIYKDENGELKANTTIQNAYDKDGESLPNVEEIRNLILESAKSATEDQITGVLFIDRFGSASTVADYKSYGPNNEVYLAPGQSISFMITDGASVNKVRLAMKALGATADVWIYDATVAKDANGKPTDSKKFIDLSIASSTDMYYDISKFIGATVVIENVSTDGTLLSITNKKVTHLRDTGSAGSLEGGDFVVNTDTAGLALLSLNGASTIPAINATGASLAYEDEVKYNVYFTADDITDVMEMGLITFGEKLTAGTIHDAQQIIPGYVVNGTEYMVSTNGISAKQMGDAVYFKVYAKLADGSYAYSDVLGYSAAVYAQNILSSDTASAESKALVVALMNYGAEAQKYFGYKTDALMNGFLTEDQLNLVSGYDAGAIADPVAADGDKASGFGATGGFTGFGATVSFEGAFSINYYVTPDVDAEVTMYYWTLADYTAAAVLSADNATGAIVMTGEGEVSATVSGIAAKEMEDTVYVALVYEADGQQYTTGVKAYSLAVYCKSVAAKADSEMQALAQATAVYGSYAKACFE